MAARAAIQSPRRGGLSFPPAVVILLAAMLAASSLQACSFVDELAHMERLSVVSASPEEAFVLPGNVKEVSVTFSEKMRKAFAEDAFSLKGDSVSVSGTFSWRDGGRTLAFEPLAPLDARRSYTFSVSTSAEDEYGNSLEDAFSKTFHTRSETTSPFLVSHSPAGGSTVSSREPVVLLFSEPMDAASVLSSFGLSPRPEGFFSWNAEGNELVFTPLEEWTAGESFDTTVGSGCLDREGNGLAEERTFRFFGPGTSALSAVSVSAVRGGFTLAPSGPGGFADPSLRTEKDESFRIVFNRPPEAEKRRGLVSVNPSAAFSLAWDADGAACVLSFTEDLAWGAVYEIAAAGTICRFVVNGEGSVPLSVRRVVYIRDIAAGSPVFEELLLSGNYDFPDSATAAFDVYVGHGTGAAVEFASFLDAFSLSVSNGCVEFVTFGAEIAPVSPAPLPAAGAGETVFRVFCSTDDVLACGIVTVGVSTGLRDDRGNGLAVKFSLPVNKQ